MWKRIKRAFHNFLLKLGQENKEMFGDSTPDCCRLNRQDAEHKR